VIDVLLAAPSLACESDLVATAPSAGVRVVRRCIDAVDVLAAVASHPGAVPILSASLPRLVAATVERLGPRTLGLAEDDEDAQRLRALGVHHVVSSSETPLWSSLMAQMASSGPRGDVIDDGTLGGQGAGGESIPKGSGSAGLIAVWGPPGAPGRTTVAIGLADALACEGHRVCLVDADTYAPSLALALGAGTGGVTAACARAESGTEVAIASLCSQVSTRLSVLGGLGPSQSWRDLRPSSLSALWNALREEFDVVVVDVGFCIEDPEAESPWATRRNAAAVTALQAADQVVAVAHSTPAGAARLASEWPRIVDATLTGVSIVVQNRAPRRVGDWQLTVSALGVDAPIVSVPEDVRCVASCWSRAATFSEHAPRSHVTRAMRTLAAAVVRD
jgi:Mrp family chromosome partitioning ATPase